MNTLSEYQRAQLAAIGLNVQRPSQDAQGNAIEDNCSGEDFLYMHRQMIQDVNRILAAGNYPYGKQVVGWVNIPAPGDTDWPVPPAYGNDAFLTQAKSDDYYTNTIRQRC